ncbi:MAG: CpaF family protein [Anaerovoracaceae bacterium]|jgi:pilus assembly protein CpaF
MDEHTRRIGKRKLEEVRVRFLESSPEEGAEGDEVCRRIIEQCVLEARDELSVADAVALTEMIFDRTRSRMGVIRKLVEDETVSEIMVNGAGSIFYEDPDGIHRSEILFDSTEELEELIRGIAGRVHREINELNPILDARLEDGSRVNAVYKNIVAEGPVLTIRKFARERITMQEMIERGTVTAECAEYLRTLVLCGYNVFISGGTSSGKTTFLNALTDFIPERERVIVIEDSRELMLPHIPNLVQMECHNANMMGKGEVGMDQLIRTSLRMRPDRIIVGEIRGREVADMLQAMNTGHDGSMSTGHGNSVRGMLRRLEAMYLMGSAMPMDAIRAQITEGIDIMVHLSRMDDGSRKVAEIREVIGEKNGEYQLNPLFLMDERALLRRTENRLANRFRAVQKGREYGDRL